jgi:primosomal protein N' (replication factor Y)
MTHRASLGFPPLGRLASVLVSAERELDAQAAATAVASAVSDAAPACTLLGPAPAPLPRLRARYRWQLLLKGDDATVRQGAQAALGAVAKFATGVQGAVDVRPWSML